MNSLEQSIESVLTLLQPTLKIGTLEQIPTQEVAANGVNGLRMSINAERVRQRQAVLSLQGPAHAPFSLFNW